VVQGLGLFQTKCWFKSQMQVMWIWIEQLNETYM
jgi:hypothetical protein